jgi:hypothetical protein
MRAGMGRLSPVATLPGSDPVSGRVGVQRASSPRGRSRTMPSIRATQLKSDLAALDDLVPGIREQVLARLRPGFALDVASASRLDWMPVAEVVSLCRVLREVTDEETVRTWCRRATSFSLQTPLFRPILQGALAIFGRDPQRVYKVMPTAWIAAMKDCGQLVADVATPGVVTLTIHGMPAVARDRDFLIAAGGAFEVVLDECGVEGRCQLELQGGLDPRYVTSWGPRPA